MPYLMIRNPGQAPVEGFTLLGVSTTRFAGNANTIGMFGSGSKHAINLLLRNDIRPTIYSGKLQMDFFTKPCPVDDGLSTHTYSKVCVKFKGSDEVAGSSTKTQDLGFVLEHGTHDWKDLAMGLREFVSNALDRCVRETESFKGVEIEVVDKPRGKSGHTSVFIPYTVEVEKFHRELPKRFLHFSEPELLNQSILPKKDRNLSETKVAVIYKRGVFVREFTEDDGKDSIYDYNLQELELDESRNSQPWTIKAEVASVLANAPAEKLVALFTAVLEGKEVFESKLDSYHLKPKWTTTDEEKEARRESFAAAWKVAAGDNAVVVSGTQAPTVAEYVKKKGFTPAVVKEACWAEAIAAYGVATDSQVLTDLEKKGNTISEPTEDMLLAVQKVWNIFVAFGMTQNRPQPPVKAFTEIMDGESQRLGYWQRSTQTVFLHTDLGVGQSHMLLQTALEECTHHVTQAGDMSRDLQDFLFRLVTKMAL